MEGKKVAQLPRRHPKTVSKYRLVFLWFWGAFGRLLAPFSAPFRHPGSLLASLWMPFGSFWKRLGPPRTCRDSAENLPRFSREFAEIRRDSAENLPRFGQEPAEIQPRTRRMNPKQTCLSHCAFFEWTAFSDKRFDEMGPSLLSFGLDTGIGGPPAGKKENPNWSCLS